MNKIIKAEITEDSILVSQGESRVGATIVREGTKVNVQLNGAPISIMDILTEKID